MNSLRWYAACTKPRSEKRAALALLGRNVEHYLPLYKKISRWKNGTSPSLDLPLFPGYLFVRISLPDRFTVLNTPGIRRLVSSGSLPAALPDDQMEVLRSSLARYRAEPHPYLSVGGKIVVRRGPLAGVSGYLAKKKNATRFVVSMDLIMRSVAVEIDANDIAPLPSSGSNNLLI